MGLQIALRMPVAMLDRLDAYVEELRLRDPAVSWTRGAAIRALILEGLATAGVPELGEGVV